MGNSDIIIPEGYEPFNGFSEGEMKFLAYHAKYPNVYEEFKKYSLQMLNAGKNHFGAWLVVNRIRWESLLYARDDDGYKISNGVTAYYARMFMRDFPEHDGVFSTKPLKV